MSATISRVETTRSKDMGLTVRPAVLPFQRHRPASPYLRIAQEWGCTDKTARDTLGPIVRKVAVALSILVDAGRGDYAGELLGVLEAPLYGGALPLPDVMHLSALADCAENEAEAHYRHRECRETAAALHRKSSGDILRLEQRNRALALEWGL